MGRIIAMDTHMARPMAVTIIMDTGTVIMDPGGTTDAVITVPEVMVTEGMDAETMVVAVMDMATEAAIDRTVTPTKQRCNFNIRRGDNLRRQFPPCLSGHCLSCFVIIYKDKTTIKKKS